MTGWQFFYRSQPENFVMPRPASRKRGYPYRVGMTSDLRGVEGAHMSMHGELWSGEWMDLQEALLLYRRKLKDVFPGADEATEQAILRLCYIDYLGHSAQLKLYSFFREDVALFPCGTGPGLSETDKDHPFRRDFSDIEARNSFNGLMPGEIFEIHESIIERLALLQGFPESSTFIVPIAVVHAQSIEAIAGWDEVDEGTADGKKKWFRDFDAYIHPAKQLRWQDLRIDRQEFLELIEEITILASDSLDGPSLPKRGKAGPPKASVSFIAALVRLIAEIASKESAKGNVFSPDDMPGTKADFQRLANQYDIELRVAESTFETYIKGICKFKRGASTSNFYSDLFPDLYRSDS